MAGLYIHIPFCTQLCNYCDFYSTAAVGIRAQMVDAILKEMQLRSDFLKDEPLETIYIGGGTPSLLLPEDIQRFIDMALKLWNYETLSEITMEANPEDLTQEYVDNISDNTDINRVSVGVQSFNNDILKYLNRRHTAETAAKAITMLRKAGFSSVSADLIYGIPGQSTATIKSDIKKALSLNIQHLSAYHLTIEEHTVFGNRQKRGLFEPVGDATSTKHFNTVTESLAKAGFIHYEVSNFASKEWYVARHNSNYWRGVPYLGVGPAAHSFKKGLRTANVASNKLYLQTVESLKHYSSEQITPSEEYHEYLMTSLRTMWGIDTAEIRKRYGKDRLSRLIQSIKPFIDSGKVVSEGTKLRINSYDFLLSDYIISKLF